AVHLDWSGLADVERTLPVVVKLKHGGSMVLRRLNAANDPNSGVLQDPNAGEEALLVIDRSRVEAVWTGEGVRVKRDYDLRSDAQAFTARYITSLVMRDWRLVRDIAISAIILGLLALVPIMFWRLLGERVMYYKSIDTFYVLCVFLIILIGFETVFS